jgi:hypothetical protein
VPCRLASCISQQALNSTLLLTQPCPPNRCAAYQALWALWTLAAQARYVERIVLSGATGSIITAMRNHPLEAGVQEQALWCVYHLTAKHPANRSRIVSLGGSDLLDLAASNHSTIQSITEFIPTIRLCLSDNVTIYGSSTSASKPSSEDALPAGWTQHFDEKTGRPYYHAASTALTVWERPTEPAPPAHRSDAAVVCIYVTSSCDIKLYIYIYIYIYIFTHTHTHIHTHTHTNIHINLYTHTHTHIHVCMCVLCMD